MGKTLNFFLYFLKFWILFSPVLSALYLAVWVIQIFNNPLFLKFNLFFGFFPNLIDKLLFVQVDLNGADVSMGYVYAAIVMILTTFLAAKVEGNLIDSYIENERREKESKIRKRTFAQRQSGSSGEHDGIFFFGLLEMKFECLNGFDKSGRDLEKLKKEYSKMLIKKLKEKYPDIQFVVSNKIFIISNEFSVFDPFLSDVVKFFRIFQELNIEKCIGSNLLLSFDCGDCNSNPKYIYRFLSKINDLGYSNKVVLLSTFVKKYKYVLTKKYITTPLGLAKIETDNQREVDVELYYLENA